MHARALLALRCKNLKREARAPVAGRQAFDSVPAGLNGPLSSCRLQLPLAFNSIPTPVACLQMQSCLDSCCSPAPLHPHTSLSYARKCHTFFQLLALHCTALVYCILSLSPFNQIHQSLHIVVSLSAFSSLTHSSLIVQAMHACF